MAYVGKPLDYDIFVSYSHGDVDATGESKVKQWSQAFARELESEFRAQPKFGHDVTIQLQSDFARAAILTVLMSPYYLESKWCQDEREWWYSKQAELGLPSEERIAVVRIWPTEKNWPKEFDRQPRRATRRFLLLRQKRRGTSASARRMAGADT